MKCRACECVQPDAAKCKRCGKPGHTTQTKTIAQLEREAIISAVSIYGPTRAAKELGINRRTLYRKMCAYGIKRKVSY